MGVKGTKLKETDNLEDLDFHGCMPLTWILKT
jgi:hypothetical protein